MEMSGRGLDAAGESPAPGASSAVATPALATSELCEFLQKSFYLEGSLSLVTREEKAADEENTRAAEAAKAEAQAARTTAEAARAEAAEAATAAERARAETAEAKAEAEAATGEATEARKSLMANHAAAVVQKLFHKKRTEQAHVRTRKVELERYHANAARETAEARADAAELASAAASAHASAAEVAKVAADTRVTELMGELRAEKSLLMTCNAENQKIVLAGKQASEQKVMENRLAQRELSTCKEEVERLNREILEHQTLLSQKRVELEAIKQEGEKAAQRAADAMAGNMSTAAGTINNVRKLYSILSGGADTDERSTAQENTLKALQVEFNEWESKQGTMEDARIKDVINKMLTYLRDWRNQVEQILDGLAEGIEKFKSDQELLGDFNTFKETVESLLRDIKVHQIKLQKAKPGVRFYVKINPLVNAGKDMSGLSKDEQTEKLAYPQNLYDDLKDCTGAICKEKYTWDHLFSPSVTQAEVFEEIGFMCESVVGKNGVAGLNAVVEAYGQSGSGKTYTMVGKTGEEMGIIPRAAEALFKLSQTTLEVKAFEIISMFDPARWAKKERPDLDNGEYNRKWFQQFKYSSGKGNVIPRYLVSINIVNDLNELDPDLPPEENRPKEVSQICTDSSTGVQRKEICPILVVPEKSTTVATMVEFYDWLGTCQGRRRTAKTMQNDDSSRSHLVVQIKPANTSKTFHGTLTLLDLAGSEASEEQVNVKIKSEKLDAYNNFIKGRPEKDSTAQMQPSKQTDIGKRAIEAREFYWGSMGINFSLRNMKDTLKNKKKNPSGETALTAITGENLSSFPPRSMGKIEARSRNQDTFSKWFKSLIPNGEIKVLVLLGLNAQNKTLDGSKNEENKTTLEFFLDKVNRPYGEPLPEVPNT